MKLPNGYGTIAYKKGRRNPYEAYAPAVQVKGGGYKKTFIGSFPKRSLALQALEDLHRSGCGVDRLHVTLEQIYTEWSEGAYKNITKSTINGYKAAWKVFEPLYRTKVKDLRSGHFQRVIDTMAGDGYSRSAMAKAKVLAGLLETYAVQNDIIDKNYAEFIKLPKAEENEKEIFSDLQLRKIEQAAAEGVGVADLILIMCYTGWRIGEFCDLTPFSYDPDKGTLTGGNKTEAGKNRVVYLSEKIKPYVDKYVSAGMERLFGHNVKQLRAEFYETLELLDIYPKDAEKFTPHVTRHTCNSLLNRAGVDVKTRMLMLGHSDEKTNIKVYTHADEEQLRAAVNSI